MSTGTVKPGQRLIRAAKPHGVQRIEPPAQRGSTYGTAVYGPVHTVVWEGRTGDRSPYPDPYEICFCVLVLSNSTHCSSEGFKFRMFCGELLICLPGTKRPYR